MSVVTREEMITALDCGRQFYVEASEREDREDLKILFRDMARFKQAMLEDLRLVPDQDRGQADTVGLSGTLQRAYAEIQANWDIDKNHRYLASLVASEDQILHAFGSAMVNSSDSLMRGVARKHLEALIQGHRRLLKLRYAQPTHH